MSNCLKPKKCSNFFVVYKLSDNKAFRSTKIHTKFIVLYLTFFVILNIHLIITHNKLLLLQYFKLRKC